MTCRAGDIVVVRFPFTDQVGVKQRPAVVASTVDYNANRPDVVLLAITSQIKQPLGFAEAMIADWKTAGLLKPSVFKPVIFTAEQQLIRKSLGRLSSADHETLQSVLDAMLCSP